MSGTMFILFEAASGYSLFEVTGLDELQAQADAVQQAVSDMNRFGRVVKLIAFVPFKSAADALEQVNAVSEATMTDELRNFLELNLPKVSTADLLLQYSRMCSLHTKLDNVCVCLRKIQPVSTGQEGQGRQEEKEVPAGSRRVENGQLYSGGDWHPMCVQ